MEVRREIVLPVTREEVWAALTDPERLEEWFAGDVELDPRPGGLGVFRWGNGEERHAVVERVEPEERLELAWDDDAHVAFTLEDDPEGTRLSVVESAPDPQACAAEWSWGIELWSLELTRPLSSPRSPIRLAVA
jgi:uncharacterized protein YndB with AHSA1/START domain